MPRGIRLASAQAPLPDAQAGEDAPGVGRWIDHHRQIAALLLDKMGVLTKPRSGSTNARRTAAEIELDRREQAAALYDRSESFGSKELLTGNARIWPIEALKAPRKE